MKSFMKVIKEDSEYMESVNEGWGRVMLLTATTLGLIAGPHAFPASLLPMAGVAGYELYSLSKITKIFKEPKLKKYLDNFNKKTFNTFKKKSPNITMRLPNRGYNYDAWLKSSTDSGPLKYSMTYFGNIFVYYDATHIQEVRCVYYNTANKQYINKKVPAPDKKELGYYEE